MAVGNYTVATYGNNNLFPHEIQHFIKHNHLLPEILKKQVRFMFGTGPYLYKTITEDKKKTRVPVDEEFPQVWQWLNNWQNTGLKDDMPTYLKQVILEYYYTEGVFSKWIMNRSRRTSGNMPVRGLEYIPSTRLRFAAPGKLEFNTQLEDEWFKYILYGDWKHFSINNHKVYHRFNPAKPLKHGVSVNYTKDFGFAEEIYSFPTFYYGLKEWIKGSNLNPKYVNSYLKNALSARLHVIIPDVWIRSKQETLKAICEANLQRDIEGQELQTEYDGLTGIGATFNHGMVQKLIDKKLELLTNVMSGEGENQGKTFFTRSFRTEHGLEQWEIKEIPSKYKEYIESIIDFDKRTVQVILEGKGLDPSISNVSNDGVFGKSGSDAYYNYIIYLNTLFFAEDFCTKDINLALSLNFPELTKAGVKLGFYRYVPERTQDVSSKNRVENN